MSEAKRPRGGRGRGRGSKIVWALLLLVVAAGLGGLALRWGWVDRATVQSVDIPLPAVSGSQEVTLFFADPRWTRLVPEQRRLQLDADPVETVRALIGALAEGPRGDGAPVLPPGAGLRGVYLGAEGLLVVDFDPALATFDGGGVSGELLTVFALVHTLAENLPDVRRVQILSGGEAKETLAGHVKISEPLAPDARWTSGAGP